MSGDNRKGRLAAFHSEASNLVGGDSNGVADVFVYKRPSGWASARAGGRVTAAPREPDQQRRPGQRPVD